MVNALDWRNLDAITTDLQTLVLLPRDFQVLTSTFLIVTDDVFNTLIRKSYRQKTQTQVGFWFIFYIIYYE